MDIRFVVPGPPQGKARARTVRHGGRTRTYTPARTAAYEQQIRLACIAAMQGAQPVTGEVRMEIDAVYAVPKRVTRAKLAAIEHGARPMCKPDIDNIAKAVCDALNGIAYRDDAQIAQLTIGKYYGTTPRVEVRVVAREGTITC